MNGEEYYDLVWGWTLASGSKSEGVKDKHYAARAFYFKRTGTVYYAGKGNALCLVPKGQGQVWLDANREKEWRHRI